MRIAAISDTHGNLLAPEAVLADLATQDVDVVVDLGDLLSGAVQPAETADRLMELGCSTVRGNHERQLLTQPRAEMGAADRLAHDRLTAAHRAWLAGLPATLTVGDSVLAFHGTPTDDLTYLLDTVDTGGARPATPDEVLARLGDAAEVPLLLCGHTHLPRQLRLPTGALVVNPGSVGWPAYADDRPHPHGMEAGSPHARYAVLDDAGGRWTAACRTVGYDWDGAAAIAARNGRPDDARQLRTGRV